MLQVLQEMTNYRRPDRGRTRDRDQVIRAVYRRKFRVHVLAVLAAVRLKRISTCLPRSEPLQLPDDFNMDVDSDATAELLDRAFSGMYMHMSQ